MSDFDLRYKPMRKPELPSADKSGPPQPRRKPAVPQAGDDFVLSQAAPRKPAATTPASFAVAMADAGTAAGTAVDAPTPGRKPTPPAGARSPTMDDFTQSARSAARIANVPFADVLAKAAQESNFNVNAKSGTSTAAGPYQFVEQTWLDMLKRHGAAYGLGKDVAQIKMHNGVASVSDPAMRKQLLDLRKDVNLSAGMAARYLDESGKDLGRILHRKPSAEESRMAYFLGPGGAAKLIRAARNDPNGAADQLLPNAASANRNMFYGADGPLSNREAMAKITRFVNRSLKDVVALSKEDHPVVTDRVVSPDPNVG
ncbi:MAG: lytic transglycosylase domain-containing protein [Rhodospirillaceae bacterium]